MGAKDVLKNRKEVIETSENKDKELKNPTEHETESGATSNTGEEPLTDKQIRNIARHVYAVEKVLDLHKHMHNEHYKAGHEHEVILKEHAGHHKLTHDVLGKMIDEKSKTQGAQ